MQQKSTSDTDVKIPKKDQLLETANENMIPFPGSSPCFELGPEDKPTAKLRLLWKDGNRCFFPYAYMLRAEFQAEGILTIYTSEQEIVIKGRGLDHIEDLLYESQVRSIQESKVTFDAGNGPVFVSSIEIVDR